MYNNKRCIGLIFDRSYLVYDVGIGMKIIYNILYRNKNNAHYVFGGIPRFVEHTKEYAKALKIEPSLLHELCIPYYDDHYLAKTVIADWLQKVLDFMPDEIYILRDDGHTNETTTLIEYCLRNKIPVTEYNNRGDEHVLGYGGVYNTNQWFKLNQNIGRKYKDNV